MKSGNLNFLEPSGPLQAFNGTALRWLLVAKIFCQVFNFADLVNIVSLTAINCYIITTHNGMAPIKNVNGVVK